MLEDELVRMGSICRVLGVRMGSICRILGGDPDCSRTHVRVDQGESHRTDVVYPSVFKGGDWSQNGWAQLGRRPTRVFATRVRFRDARLF